MPSITLVDPLTLLGRELLEALPRLAIPAGSVRYVHTGDDDEHQIAELAGQAALVPALTSSDELSGCDAVLIASDRTSTRTRHLERFLGQHPEAPVIDLGRLPALRSRFAVVCPGTSPSTDARHLRVPHPALAATAAVTAPLEHLGLTDLSILVVEPVSALGGSAVEELAAQSLERLQGREPEHLIDDRIRAFNLFPLDDIPVQDEAVEVFPGLDVLATRTLGCCFHGHLVHLTLGFESPLSVDDLEITWSPSPGLERIDDPVSLDLVVSRDEVLLTRPAVSADGRRFVLSAVADGLRIGGATTAVALLAGLLRL